MNKTTHINNLRVSLESVTKLNALYRVTKELGRIHETRFRPQMLSRAAGRVLETEQKKF